MELEDKLYGSMWLAKQIEKEVKRDSLKWSERVGEVAAIICTFIVIIFFAIHQTRPTGFFTDEFGTADSVLLYLMLLIGVVPAFIRLLLGSRNAARPFDAFSLAVFCVGSLYFLATFPFDFTYFAEPFPDSLEFLIDWISADLAKLLLVLGAIAAPFFSVYTYILYLGVKKRMAQPPAQAQPVAP